jgi:hypothetical protein
MSKDMTLGELIDTKDYSGVVVKDDWFLQYNDIDSIVGLNVREDDDHYDKFEEMFALTHIEICTWTCNDSRVGLILYCIDGEPIMISSQTSEESDLELAFVSMQTGIMLEAAWKMARPLKLLDWANMPIMSDSDRNGSLADYAEISRQDD